MARYCALFPFGNAAFVLAVSHVAENAGGPRSVPRRPLIPTTDENIAPGGLKFSATGDAYRKLATPHTGKAHAFFHYLFNSVIIGLLSALASVVLGTGCAYGFSRFRIAGTRDWLFFILSTRFLPPLAVVVPVLMMYRLFDLPNTHLGLILLYTAFNLSLAVWLMKGFIDEIPRAYEEAALVDGIQPVSSVLQNHLAPFGNGYGRNGCFLLDLRLE